MCDFGFTLKVFIDNLIFCKPKSCIGYQLHGLVNINTVIFLLSPDSLSLFSYFQFTALASLAAKSTFKNETFK